MKVYSLPRDVKVHSLGKKQKKLRVQGIFLFSFLRPFKSFPSGEKYLEELNKTPMKFLFLNELNAFKRQAGMLEM